MSEIILHQTRWELDQEWKKVKRNIYSYLLSWGRLPKGPLTEEGFLDLRGFSFPEHEGIWRKSFKKIDFSYCKINYCYFTKCRFENVLFSKSELEGFRQRTCYFNNVIFNDCDMANSTVGDMVGRYNNVIFKKTNLSWLSFFSPQFTNCQFIDCKISDVDFKVSNFVNCKFKGKLSETRFNGYYALKRQEKEYGKAPRNQMLNVDFSEAELHFVDFRNSCPIDNIILPNNGKFIKFYKAHSTFEKMKDFIDNRWLGKDRDDGIVYCNTNIIITKKQDGFIENRDDIYELVGERIGNKLIQLLMDVNKEITGAGVTII